MEQILGTPGTKKVSNVYRAIKSGQLILQPEFQRYFVWNKRHKEKFIQTLLLGFPTPELYIAQSGIDIDKIEAEEVVVDGQQRLGTIVEYIDEEPTSKIYGNIVKKYKDLSPIEKQRFLNYNLVFRDLGDISQEQIIEVFKRINSTQYSLNSVELHNAIYDGEFINTAKEILNKIDTTKLPFFNDTKISRMDDLAYILLIMATIEEGGYSSRDMMVEKMIVQYNEEYENSETIKERIIDTFSLIDNLHLKSDSIWLRKSSYYTMFVELYHTENLNGKEVTLRRLLVNVEETILQNKNKENKYAMFYSYLYTGTNARKARVERAEFFRSEILQQL